ncbi:histidinol-phosphate transaminase [Paenibacillus hexagrammi]|uniref:Histidinol-phosphate aminotransferase n=1 Tax=Paenibacillus hexagrammi TaxID=2908839 RepID=A0ABY3SG78_9BACL|nr:histidinol-phosphate transaminase [Paenibacillus sp. YPD9-1]UJF32719.1 histidinol-phosphate transaminase [Paenibacillus sp. YPD9-1]
MSNYPVTGSIRPREALQVMKPYSPGKPIWEVQQEWGLEKVIKLASNENPLGPSPKAAAAIQACLSDLNRYPDADTSVLKEAIAAKLGFTSEQLIVTNGAGELITLISEAFLEANDEIVVPSPTFSEYEFGAALMGTRLITVPLLTKDRYDVDGILAAVTERTKIVYICSPNNPTGTYMSKPELQRLMDTLPGHVLTVFDGAYSEFADAADYSDGLELVRRGYPILIIRTFSKVYGLAGIRVGYGIADGSIVNAIRQVKEPFNVNALAQAGAIAALEDDEHLEATRESNRRGRKQLYEGLSQLGMHCEESMSNFLWVRLGTDAGLLYNQLMQRGVIVRYGGNWGYPEHVRISVGSFEENERLLKELRTLL